MIEDLKSEYQRRESSYLMQVGRRDSIVEEVDVLKNKTIELEKQLELYTKTNVFLQSVSVVLQSKIKFYFEDLISLALKGIFDDSYKFEIEFKTLRNSLSAKFRVANNKASGDPKMMNGGGVVDVISEALRIAVLELCSPKVTGPLVLDERFARLSEDYVNGAANFLLTVCEQFNRQVILVTHQEEFSLYAKKVFTF